MKCVVCGEELAENALLCPRCGSVVRREDVVRQQAASRQLTKKEFFELPGMKTYRNNIRSCGVVLYLCAAMTVLMALFEWGETSAMANGLTRQIITSVPPSLMSGIVTTILSFLIRFDRIIAAALLVGLGIWIQLGKSRVAALLTLIYGSYSMIIGSLEFGRLQGWWEPVIGGFGVFYTFKLHGLWGKYRRSGTLPPGALEGK